MKRDLELIRNILIAIEREDVGDDRNLTKERLGFGEIAAPFFDQHIAWMEEAGLVTVFEQWADNKREIIPLRLTFLGCEYLDNIRDDRTWKKALALVAEKVVSASLSNIVTLAGTTVLSLIQGK